MALLDRVRRRRRWRWSPRSLRRLLLVGAAAGIIVLAACSPTWAAGLGL